MAKTEKLDGKTLIPVVNKLATRYGAVLRNGEMYEWLPATTGFEDVIEMPFRDVQVLHMTSATFRDGYLYIDHAEARKRLGLERDDLKANLVSREEIEEALQGSLDDMKKAFSGVKTTNVLREIAQAAKDLNIDELSKLQYVSDITGIPVDVLLLKD